MAQELNVQLPGELGLGATYSVRVTALDASGNAVAGVKIGAVTITADQTSILTETPTQTKLGGDWFLVPGPGA